jgi:ATP synthase subunit 6
MQQVDVFKKNIITYIYSGAVMVVECGSPLEQFEVVQYCSYSSLVEKFVGCSLIFKISFLYTNIFIRILFRIGIFIFIYYLRENLFYKNRRRHVFIRRNVWFYNFLKGRLISFNTKMIFLPILLFLSFFVLILNISGLLPFYFTLTSHLSLTLGLSLIFFFRWNRIGRIRFKYRFVLLLVPSNLNFFITFFLIGIEFISYCSRVVSLAVRLFANMVAGHSLLKILIIFCFRFSNNLGLSGYFIGLRPFLIRVGIFGLEIIIRILQTYVFIILLILYLIDVTYITRH